MLIGNDPGCLPDVEGPRNLLPALTRVIGSAWETGRQSLTIAPTRNGARPRSRRVRFPEDST